MFDGIVVWTAHVISSVGAMNWGLKVFFGIDLVERCCSVVKVQGLDRVLYGLVALSGLFAFVSLFFGGM